MSQAEITAFRSVTGQELEKRVWLPDGEPRAVMQFVHGMAEHIARYDGAAQALNAAGFAVVGHTHLGHGDKAPTPGYFADENGWDALIEDTHAVRVAMQERFADVPYFLLGHSMGSFVVRTYCLVHEDGLKGVVLSGTGHFDPPILAAGTVISGIQRFFGGAKKPCRLLERMSFAGYNDGFEKRTAFDWLSKNHENVDQYIRDPYCGFPFTAKGYADMFSGLKRLAPQNLSAMSKDIPVYLFSGADDPVGAKGKGVTITADELRQAGISDVTVKLYEKGRHEMFNEPEREAVYQDLIAWVESKL